MPTVVAFFVGAGSLIGQFIFNRIIFFYLANSEYTAASIITLHLAGFWLGATLARRRIPRVGFLLCASIAMTFTAEILVWRSGILWFDLPMLVLLTMMSAVGLATVSGALITALMGLGKEPHHGQRIFMADTAGSVVGALVGGFWLIPFCGIAVSFHALLTLQLAVLAFSHYRQALPAIGIAMAGLAGVMFLQLTPPAVTASPKLLSVEGLPFAVSTPDTKLVYSSHTPFGLLSIVDTTQTRAPTLLRGLRNNSRALCSATDGDNTGNSQWQVGEKPIRMLIPASGRTNLSVASIGLGCGLSLAGTLRAAPPETRVDVIEIDPGIPAAQRFFAPLLQPGMDDPRVHMVIKDGFRFFAERKNKTPYDAVVIDLAWLQNMNTTHLYSMEMYENVRRNLAKDGILAVWTEDGNPFSPVARIIYATLRRVFPYVVVDMSGGTTVFYASMTRKDLTNFLPETSQTLSDWLAAVPPDAEVNRLDNLVMNRYRFDSRGDSDVENVAAKISEMRSALGK